MHPFPETTASEILIKDHLFDPIWGWNIQSVHSLLLEIVIEANCSKYMDGYQLGKRQSHISVQGQLYWLHSSLAPWVTVV